MIQIRITVCVQVEAFWFSPVSALATISPAQKTILCVSTENAELHEEENTCELIPHLYITEWCGFLQDLDLVFALIKLWRPPLSFSPTLRNQARNPTN
jgi:hypothetical protein